MSDERSLRTRIGDRVRASTMRELARLSVRLDPVEEAFAENRALRGGLAQLLAQAEADVRVFRGDPW